MPMITASSTATHAVWNKALADYLDFSGSPVTDLQAVDDPGFVMGPIFCASMKLLSGIDPEGESVQKNLNAMRHAAADATDAEKRHVKAVEFLAQGEFTLAGQTWDALLAEHPEDVLAHKCAHETWFLVGDIASMLSSTTAAIERLSPDSPAFAVAASQHGLALEESGDYQAAEGWGRLALEMVPSDCWALHCLAHVYESQNRHTDAMALLNAKKHIWSEQNLLDAHIWWHLTLRLVEAGDYASALAIFDENLAEVPASNRFRLTDGTSLLWRLQLEGVDVGDRWRPLAEKWAKNANLHCNPFLDMHAVLAFANCPDMPATCVFFESLEASYQTPQSELAHTYHEVLKPLVRALSAYTSNPADCIRQLEPLLPGIHKLGGSVVQRELVERSYSSALLAAGKNRQAEAYLQPKLNTHPNTSWLLRAAARAKEASGDTISATLLNRRADLMFRSFS